jgi:hypothetical protein
MVAVGATLLSGCANERSSPLPPAISATTAPTGQIPVTMSSRVLAAIALERVTGRTPDPGRLVGGK